jgi:hypothetical protein
MIGVGPMGQLEHLTRGVFQGVFQFGKINREHSVGYTEERLYITNIDLYWNTGTPVHPIYTLSWGFAKLNMTLCNTPCTLSMQNGCSGVPLIFGGS